MKHTPGPYEIEDVTEDGGWLITATADDGSYVVLAGRAPWPKRAEMSLANARLIAAAPEMLEALEDIARPSTRDPFEMACIAERAIAKAEGREP